MCFELWLSSFDPWFVGSASDSWCLFLGCVCGGWELALICGVVLLACVDVFGLCFWLPLLLLKAGFVSLVFGRRLSPLCVGCESRLWSVLVAFELWFTVYGVAL